MTHTDQRRLTREFIQRWTGRGYEKGESQTFWLDLLTTLGVERPADFITFENQVRLDHTSFIDGFIPTTHVLIEQKSLGKDLRAPIRQSDGSMLNPFQQAKRYAAELPYSERPRWIITCNFEEFLVYNMEEPNKEPDSILLKDLEKELYRLNFLVRTQSDVLQKEMELSLAAGELVGRLYDALLAQYLDPTSPHALKSLNALCVRLVFCLYAEDAGLFGAHTAFHDYLASFQPENVRTALIELFRILDTKPQDRDPYARPELLAFPYVNGGLFRDEHIEIPRFTPEILHLLLHDCSADFDWSGISPTIFGAVFESTLNPETRRSGGMHYTSIENIHKVIDPLFLHDLVDTIDKIETIDQPRKRESALKDFQQHLASLHFLDPACGSGNFLTETFLSLRRLENRVLKLLRGDTTQLSLGGDFSPIKVSISQFYGIEINDFAATVAKTALWIAESQMMRETEDIVGRDLDFLPLKTYTNITEGNALRLDWRRVVSPSPATAEKSPTSEALLPQSNGLLPGSNGLLLGSNATSPALEAVRPGRTRVRLGSTAVRPGRTEVSLGCTAVPPGGTGVSLGGTATSPATESTNPLPEHFYIMGNPPFVGFTFMSKEQKEDMQAIFPGVKNLDFVCAWYKKASDFIKGTNVKCAFVSTNSITQGETVARFWDFLDVKIDFAYRTFRWDSEASLKAHVHCVIIGFSNCGAEHKYIYDGTHKIEAKNINAYLADAPNVLVRSRSTPICDVPKMIYGNKPVDGGNLILEACDYDDYVRREPQGVKFIHPLLGAAEFINNKKRWCFWLVNASPAELRTCPLLMKRIQACKESRANSIAAAIRKFADTPTIFAQCTQPEGVDFLLVPRVSSERRRYVPMGYVKSDVKVTDLVQIIPSATLYHFGVLTSNVHMAWMRAVCGRLKSDYRYSKDVVYNNFPWPTPTAEQRAKIEETAQGILSARAAYPDSSLADLYDETTMPPELRRAHQQNDRAVLAAYAFPVRDFTEPACVARLMELYQRAAK